MLSQYQRLLRRILRIQQRAPGTSLLIAGTLAVGLGASVTVFSVADPMLLRPLPFPEPSELAVISSAFPQMHLGTLGLSGPEALEFIRLTDAFSHVGILEFDKVTVGTSTDPLPAVVARASADTFEALRPSLAGGRFYDEHDDAPGAAPVAVLGFEFWRRAFGSNPALIGQTVLIDGASTTIAGVMGSPSGLLNRTVDLWLPLGLTTATAGHRADHRFTLIARRKPGVTAGAASANVEAAVARWQMATGEFHAPVPAFHPLRVRALSTETTGGTAGPLLALSAAVALVMLIACANVSNLLLARAEGRRAEVATHIALGARTRDVLALYITEAVVLAVAGGAAGIALAALGISTLKSFGPALARPEDIQLNVRVLMFGSAAALAAGLAVGVVPALSLDSRRAFRWLQSAGRGSVGRTSGHAFQRTLIAVQLAVAIVLSVAAVTVVRRVIELTRLDPGFRSEHVIRAQIELPASGYQNDQRTFDFYDAIVERVAGVPGVRGAAAMSGAPPLRPANNTTFSLDAAPMSMDHRSIPQVDFIQHVTPGYFAVMGIPVRAGRVFTAADDERGAAVGIVNETLARRFWPGQTAIGHRLRAAGLNAPWFTVVGIVGDVKQAGLQAAPGGEFYVPYRQSRRLFSTWVPHTMNVVVASDGDPSGIAHDLRRVVREIEPAAALTNIQPMADVISGSIAGLRLMTAVLASFAIVAVLLSAIGVHGVAAALVTSRTAEFGVRAALGATPTELVRQVLLWSAPPVAAGMALGILESAVASRLMSSLVYSTSGPTFAAHAGAAVGLSAIALVSTLVPALRAGRIDPLTALRHF